MKRSELLTVLWFTTTATLVLVGALNLSGSRWPAVGYALFWIGVIGLWDWLTGLARGATSRRKQWSGRVHSSSLAPRRNTRRAA